MRKNNLEYFNFFTENFSMTQAYCATTLFFYDFTFTIFVLHLELIFGKKLVERNNNGSVHIKVKLTHKAFATHFMSRLTFSTLTCKVCLLLLALFVDYSFLVWTEQNNVVKLSLHNR